MLRTLSLAAIVIGVLVAVFAFAPLGAVLIIGGILGTLGSLLDTSADAVERQDDIDSRVDDVRTSGTFQNHI